MNDEKGMAPAERAQETGVIPENISGFLDTFCAWESREPNLLAAGLCGSQARGTARPASDIDLVMIAGDPQPFHADTD